MHVVDTLKARGFLKQSTDENALKKALDDGPVTFYAGFDPTGDSLHAGHLMPILCMRWLQQAGHKPIVVLGGGTAMVGDPTGKDKTREIITQAQIDHNMAGQSTVFGKILDLDQARMINNGDWLLGLNYVAFLRDIGRHFSINRMLSAEGTRQRIERNQGMSFIEFNYHLLQSYDYWELHQRYGCTLQLGGDDQWFNILGGVDLIRRMNGAHVHALTVPLLTRTDGKKMGKTESGAVWADPAKLSAFDYFQYWINVPDQDVPKFLGLYTTLPLEQVEELAALKGAEVRRAKRVLGLEATAMIHGRAAAEQAAGAAAELFGGKGKATDMPSWQTTLPVPLVDVLVGSGLANSKSAARRLIKQGGCRIGEHKVTDQDQVLDSEAVVWAGKKRAVQVVSG